MKRLPFFLSILFLCSISEAQSPSKEYLIYTVSYTPTQLNTLKTYGYKLMAQPSENTSLLMPNNTNYWDLTITTALPTENTVILSGLANGKVKLLRQVEVLNSYDTRIGGLMSSIVIQDCTTDPARFICKPADFELDWSIFVSSI